MVIVTQLKMETLWLFKSKKCESCVYIYWGLLFWKRTCEANYCVFFCFLSFWFLISSNNCHSPFITAWRWNLLDLVFTCFCYLGVWIWRIYDLGFVLYDTKGGSLVRLADNDCYSWYGDFTGLVKWVVLISKGWVPIAIFGNLGFGCCSSVQLGV